MRDDVIQKSPGVGGMVGLMILQRFLKRGDSPVGYLERMLVIEGPRVVTLRPAAGCDTRVVWKVVGALGCPWRRRSWSITAAVTGCP